MLKTVGSETSRITNPGVTATDLHASLEEDMDSLALADFVDIEELQTLMECMFKFTKVGGAILDVSGKILVCVKMEDICANFHRAHPGSAKNCLESDLALSSGVPCGAFKAYRCKNGMWDIVTPLYIGEKHLGNIYVGQFFYEDEEVDYEAFRAQARTHGFDEADYMAALDRVPRLKRETVDSALAFYAKIATMISTLSYSKACLSRDIAERKRMQAELRLKTQMLQMISDNMLDLVALTDMEGRFTFVGASHRLLGYDLKSLIGRNVLEFVHPQDANRATAVFRDFVSKSEDNAKAEYRYRCADGRYVWFETTGKIIRDENGSPCQILFNTREVTARKQQERELEEAKRHAEAASIAKSQFLANMSHEIRTPLNGILGFTELLQQTPINSTQKEYLRHTRQSGLHLLSVISDILDFSKIEADRMELEIRWTDMRELLENSIGVVKYEADQKKLAVRLDVDPRFPRFAKTDPVRLTQILTNLLGNAVKFTEEGEVALRCDFAPMDANQATLSFSVRDTGIGIPPENQERIFESFSQADESMTRRYGGTGLGLAISARIARKMNSRIHCASAPGKGAVFSFDLQTEVEHHDQRATRASATAGAPLDALTDTGSVVILVAEDNPTSMILLKTLLGKLLPNARVLEARNGRQAVELFVSTEIDLIFMDIQMPDTDGREAAKAIRRHEASAEPRTPIIALTAGALKEDKDLCFAAGMDDFLTKPIQPETLRATLLRFIPSASRSRREAPLAS